MNSFAWAKHFQTEPVTRKTHCIDRKEESDVNVSFNGHKRKGPILRLWTNRWVKDKLSKLKFSEVRDEAILCSKPIHYDSDYSLFIFHL